MRHATITIANPCAERWAAMTLTATGRHCASCQETVVDFTCMTDAEVVAFLRRHPSVSCGRFRESQTSRELLAAAQPISGWRRWLGATVALMGLGALAVPKAQGQNSPPAYWGGPAPVSAAQTSVQSSSATATEQTTSALEQTINSAASEPTVAADELLISGVVRNRWGFRQEGVRVRLSSAPLAVTDKQGRFQLIVPRGIIGESSTLRVRYSNSDKGQYLSTVVAVDSARTRPYHIRLKKQERILMGAPRFR